jgi:hypothetical protein
MTASAASIRSDRVAAFSGPIRLFEAISPHQTHQGWRRHAC